LIGVAIAIVVGFIAIRIVSRVVATRRFHYFAVYTWLLGAALVIASYRM
jgi:undecaprenyl pyrophosphate phosphatase UppP